MNHNELFYWVYLSQIVLISVIIPIWIVNRLRQTVSSHPPETYPKLYPVSLAEINHALKTFKWLHAIAAVIALLFIAVSLVMGADELLNWDSQSMLTITFFLQLVPFFYLGVSGIKYQQLMRQVSQPLKRKASLKPRHVMDFIPRKLLYLAGLSLLAYAVTVLLIQLNPFPGFVGYWNLLFVLLLNVFYLVMVHRFISGKKLDPHQSNEDRLIHAKLVSKWLVIGAILCNVFLTLNLILSAMDLQHIGDIVQSLYFQVVALIMSQTTAYEPKDYSVYQDESKNSPMVS